MLLSSVPGDVAQLGERDNRTVEVRGSSPLISTMYYTSKDNAFLSLGIYDLRGTAGDHKGPPSHSSSTLAPTGDV
jgi:hypothetical protein